MQKFTPNRSKHDCDVKRSYDTQKFTPNYNKHDCDVTSTNFDPVKLRSGEICAEYSRKSYVSGNYDFIMQPYKTISRKKLRKTTHRARTYYSRGVQTFFTEGHIQNNAPKSGPVAKEKAHTTPLSCIDVSTWIRLRFLTEYKEK